MNREEHTARALLGRVLYWTGGHPYLTQRLCLTVAKDVTAQSSRDVDRICAGIFFSRRAREQDDNLLFVRERMLRSEVDLGGLLTLYGQVWRRKRVADDERDPLVTILRLAGITQAEDGRLKVRNRIYERVFDKNWVKTSMPDAELRRQREAYRRGFIRAGAISLLIIILITFLTFMAVDQRNRAQAEATRADRNAQENRRHVYVAQMMLASRDWEEGNFDRIRENLRVQFPRPGEEDLRGFEWYLFWNLCRQDAFTLEHGAGWTAATFSTDGSQVVSGGLTAVKLWDANSGQFLRTLVLSSEEESMDEAASLEALEQKRKQLWAQVEALGDFRRGSLSANFRKCGKANCRCARPGDRGHGPQYLWTATVKGQSRARNLRLGPELEKVGREVESYRRFVQLCQELVEVNEQICDLRPVEKIEQEEALDQLKKNCAGSTWRSRGGDRTLGGSSVGGMAKAGPAGFGGGRAGGSRCDAPCGRPLAGAAPGSGRGRLPGGPDRLRRRARGAV